MNQMIRKKRRKKRWIFAMRRAVLLACMLGGIAVALRFLSDHLLPKAESEQIQTATVAVENLKEIHAPIERQFPKIYSDLKKYAKTSSAAAKIYERREEYPQELLSAYLNNPEMEEFVSGYPGADYLQSKGLTADEKEQKYPLLLQWDTRWGYAPYGESVVGLSGCGPTCLSMVLVALKGDTAQTPEKIAEFSEENGYYVQGSGTAWALMTDGAAQLGLSARELPFSESTMKATLDLGQPIICSMGAGDFTTQGHFILIRGYDEEGFLVNDPNCIARSSRAWSFEKLQGQVKNLWAYSL